MSRRDAEHRARKVKARPKHAPILARSKPWNCVVLAVDTAERSGWSLWFRGELLDYGELWCMDSDASGVCYGSVVRASLVCTPAMLVFERPFRGTSQGQWIGHWRRCFFRAGGTKKHQLGVYPSTWRAKVLGNVSLPRERARALEQRIARMMAQRDVGTDAAAAICIGKWACFAPEVGAKLTERQRR